MRSRNFLAALYLGAALVSSGALACTKGKDDPSSLENRIGSLGATISQFKDGTGRTSAELMNERRDNSTLRNQAFYPANFSLYGVENDEDVLYFGGRKANPIFSTETLFKLFFDSNYAIIKGYEGMDSVVESTWWGGTLHVELADLALQGEEKEWRYFEVDTTDYDKTLIPTQRAFAEQVYGQKDDFAKNMAMLKSAQIAKTKIFVLSPEYVRKETTNHDYFIGRLCTLGSFDDHSNFSAIIEASQFHDDLKYAVRGVPVHQRYPHPK